ncbi:MAG: YtxH domain-containing protein [Nitrospirae bacterium]|nr:MAG: YtxH domain-containing protein [Nitrospirota bacterium]
MATNDSHVSAGSVALAFLSGVLLGAATAFLLAPQTGRESREGLLRAARRAGEDLRELTEKATETWNEVLTKGREFISEASSTMREAVEAGREAMQRERESSSEESTPQP